MKEKEYTMDDGINSLFCQDGGYQNAKMTAELLVWFR